MRPSHQKQDTRCDSHNITASRPAAAWSSAATSIATTGTVRYSLHATIHPIPAQLVCGDVALSGKVLLCTEIRTPGSALSCDDTLGAIQMQWQARAAQTHSSVG